MSSKDIVTEVAGDPVLPNQGGRMMQSDPGQFFPPSENELRFRAYLIFEKRGCADGGALDDWLAAEAEFSKRQEKHLDPVPATNGKEFIPCYSEGCRS